MKICNHFTIQGFSFSTIWLILWKILYRLYLYDEIFRKIIKQEIVWCGFTEKEHPHSLKPLMIQGLNDSHFQMRRTSMFPGGPIITCTLTWFSELIFTQINLKARNELPFPRQFTLFTVSDLSNAGYFFLVMGKKIAILKCFNYLS